MRRYSPVIWRDTDGVITPKFFNLSLLNFVKKELLFTKTKEFTGVIFLVALSLVAIGICIGVPIGEYRAAREVETTVESTEEPEAIKVVLYVKSEPEYTSLGEFKITAYCSCSKCCEQYAENRPNGIVYGASGAELKPNYSIAVDPDVIPYGTKVYIDGREYVAQDTGGAIDGNRIDLYMSSHEEALEWGVQYCEVFIETVKTYG